MRERILQVNAGISEKSANLQSPKDIEDLFAYESEFITYICQQVDCANVIEREGYSALGLKFDQVQLMREDQEIAQSWIDWYRHRRSQELESIKAIEDPIPAYPEVELTCTGHPASSEWVIYTNTHIPEIKYRLRQAARYSRILYTIFCTPSRAPAPGDPLPADFPVPDFDAPAPRRYTHRDYIFAANKTYSEECAKIVKIFLTAAIREGTTSDLLPFVPW